MASEKVAVTFRMTLEDLAFLHGVMRFVVPQSLTSPVDFWRFGLCLRPIYRPSCCGSLWRASGGLPGVDRGRGSMTCTLNACNLHAFSVYAFVGLEASRAWWVWILSVARKQPGCG